MNVYFLGEYIKKQREKLGLTQEQVCEGICEQVTLSRLENGRQKLTEEGVANRRSRQSVAVTAIVNIFFMAEYPFLLMSLSYST